ncbi:MAG: hypothetical protein PHF60_01925 [Candidatus ainarchaeum sp.]|nr:hypothetical protein [Candidatus ainarchaeum sp.]
MAGTLARKIVVADSPALAMANRFTKYAPETEKAVRTPQTVKDPSEAVQKMIKVWEKQKRWGYYGPLYRRMSELTAKFRYSAADVGDFCFAMLDLPVQIREHDYPPERYSDEFSTKGGLILSALVNNGIELAYTIPKTHPEFLLDRLGYMNNGKELTVLGNVERELGFKMSAGRIVVEGDAGYHVGREMCGGEIVIKGNAKGIDGQDEEGRRYSKGGRITVEGDVDTIGISRENSVITVAGHVKRIGWEVMGGEIHLNGTYDEISLNGRSKVKIYHKGKLIFGK